MPDIASIEVGDVQLTDQPYIITEFTNAVPVFRFYTLHTITNFTGCVPELSNLTEPAAVLPHLW